MNEKEKLIVFLARFLAACTFSAVVGINHFGFENFHSFLLVLVNFSFIAVFFFIGLLGIIIASIRKNPRIRPRYYGKLVKNSLLSFLILLFGWGMMVAPYA